VDILFHESTFLEKDRVRAKQTFHSTASDAARIASLAEAKKLVIGHFSTRYRDRKMFLEEAKPIFENTFLGNDGNEFTF
jgi:ribonuclease Z